MGYEMGWNFVEIFDYTYLYVFHKLLQEHLLIFPVNADLLPIIDEVIVLVGGQLLCLPISVRVWYPNKQETKPLN